MILSFLKPMPSLSETTFFHFSRYIITMRNKVIRWKLHLIPLSPNKHIDISPLRKSSGSEDSYKDFISPFQANALHLCPKVVLIKWWLVFLSILMINTINTKHVILKNNLIYLLLAVLGLHCCTSFSLVAESRGYSCCCTKASHCSGFSCGAGAVECTGSRSCGMWAQQLQLLGSRGQAQQLWHTGLVTLWSVGSSQIRD